MSPAEVQAAGALLAGGTALGVGALGIFHPRVMLFGPGIWRGPRTRRAVTLSFDDGPHPHYTPRIAKLLEDHGARGTFFCVGEALVREADVARALHAAGHELANHTHRHGTTLDLFSRRRLTADLQRCSAQLVRLTGRPSPYYRPAVGIRNPAVHAAARACDLQVVTWTDAARDGVLPLTANKAWVLANRAAEGSILALHDGARDAGSGLREQTVRHLPVLLERLRARGFQMVTLTELLAPTS